MPPRRSRRRTSPLGGCLTRTGSGVRRLQRTQSGSKRFPKTACASSILAGGILCKQAETRSQSGFPPCSDTFTQNPFEPLKAPQRTRSLAQNWRIYGALISATVDNAAKLERILRLGWETFTAEQVEARADELEKVARFARAVESAARAH
jgi:hypothetical protein